MASPEPLRPAPKRRERRVRTGLLIVVCTVAGLVGFVRWEEDGLERTARAQAFPSQFDLQQLTIPREQLKSGGPPKDGIPALSDPKFLAPQDAVFYQPADRVVGVVMNGQARAYPLRILSQHEIVNDRLADTDLAVTYCPLCDSALVFDRQRGDQTIELGVSGLLYNSNVVMYARRASEREALWSQMASAAVSGPESGQKLATIPFELTTWADWQERYPRTDVLSHETGYFRNYTAEPYAGYFQSPGVVFPVTPLAPTDRFSLKEPVLGVWNDAGARAYPLSLFDQEGPPVTLEDTLGETTFSVIYNPAAGSLRLDDVDGPLDRAYAFWFAWYAFHPETGVAVLPSAE